MNRATRIVMALVVLAMAAACIWGFVDIFSMQPSPGGLGSIGLGTLLILVAALTIRTKA